MYFTTERISARETRDLLYTVHDRTLEVIDTCHRGRTQASTSTSTSSSRPLTVWHSHTGLNTTSSTQGLY